MNYDSFIAVFGMFGSSNNHIRISISNLKPRKAFSQMFPARKCCRWSEYKTSRCLSEQQSRFHFDRACRHKHYMKIDHTLCFLQYFILRIYHCNEYAYLPNPWTIRKILSRIAGSLQFFHDQEQKNKFRQLFEDGSEYKDYWKQLVNRYKRTINKSESVGGSLWDFITYFSVPQGVQRK